MKNTEIRETFAPATLERRFVATSLEIRAEGGENDPPVIAGYAALFNTLSEDLGGFREQIDPGAFANSMGNDVRALFNHDRNIPLGRTKSKTLVMRQDDRGLFVEITPPNTATARSVVESIRRGDVDQMSFAFRTRKDEWREDRDTKEIVRTLLDVDLLDVSPVTYAAYPQTEVAVRSLEEWRETQQPAPPEVPEYESEYRRIELDLAELEI